MIQLSDIWKQESADMGLDGPLIVHCSAGVGRSGSFIAMHAGMKTIQRSAKTDSSQAPTTRPETDPVQSNSVVPDVRMDDIHPETNSIQPTTLESDSEVASSQNETDLEMPNVMELVRVMRNQRHGMVQTIEQYEFIYTVLDDEIEERKNGKVATRARSTSGSGGSGSGEGILSGSSTEQSSSSGIGSTFDADPFASHSLPSTSSCAPICPASCLSDSSCSSSPLSTNSPSSPTTPEDKGFDFEKIFEVLSCPHRSVHVFEEHEKEKSSVKEIDKPNHDNQQHQTQRNQDVSMTSNQHTDSSNDCSPQNSELFLPAVAVSG